MSVQEKAENDSRPRDWFRMVGSYQRTVLQIQKRQMELKRHQRARGVTATESDKLQARILMLEQEEREMNEKITKIKEYLRQEKAEQPPKNRRNDQ